MFVEDPGAANAVIDLPARLAALGVDTCVVASGAATAFLAANGATFDELAQGETASSLIDRTAPDAVFVGTAEDPDTLGLELVREARLRKLPSAGFVDAVSCAEHRFRGRDVAPLASCPDHVLVCDEETRSAFVRLGVPSARLEICGHPQFDALLARAAELGEEGRTALRQRVFPTLASDTRRVVVFCGERSTGGFGDLGFDAQFRRAADYTLHGRGSSDTRTEIVAEELLDAVTVLHDRPFTVLRYHPKNRAEDFGALNDEFEALSVGGVPLAVLCAADLVVGMSSMILLEASLIGKQTLSIVARPAERDWLPALAREATPIVETRGALRSFFAEWSSSAPRAAARPSATPGMSRLPQLLATIIARSPKSAAPGN